MIHARFRVDYPDFSLQVSFELPGRGITALFGPSGSGKTTCLRAIAGLEENAVGDITVNGAAWQCAENKVYLPAHRRAVGYVFQEVGLFDHLSVRQNIEYGMKRIRSRDRKVPIAQVVALLGIEHLLHRRPHTLSGGERQRVGIARSLAVSPEVLLMDEPLAALDAERKQEFMPYLERLHAELDIPIIYVSHSIDEVCRLADFLVLLKSGRVIASGGTFELLTRLDLPLAHGDGASTVFTATVQSYDAEYNLCTVDFPGGSLTLPMQPIAVGSVIRIRIFARDISLAMERPSATSILNILSAMVLSVSDDEPGYTIVSLGLRDSHLLARITRKSARGLDLSPGQVVFAQIKGVAVQA